MSDSDVLIRIVGQWGHITLNRPRALNALTFAMCNAIDDALAAWTRDSGVLGVLIDGAGERGFCAGADIRALYDAIRKGEVAQADVFFAREYRLNARIAKFPKPYIALMDGLTMGGGVGLSAHGSHRVVSERTVLAMPEVGIGFIPDVGATYLLGRVPDNLGTHAALTAMRLTGADSIAIGLADYYVPGQLLDDLRQRVLTAPSADHAVAALRACATAPPASALLEQRGWTQSCYDHASIDDILVALGNGGEAAHMARTVIAAQSPTAIKLTLRALRAGRGYNAVEPCLQQEYRVALRCMRAPDFTEGVRAAVVDKDRTPHWQPDSLAQVDEATLDRYFAPLGAAELLF
ncbi:MAG: enoyl-CoA hydratase/isomerase family protein [Acidiphilium sp.]|nr:enoyl-CoA hydratase/isomerase family protein [Acidiphilium sp.]MDD4936404.1 enoyl-CoA hydratase/isomerase family protein [Acidiphilium sp.]